ncbi:serine/threonine-protein phosphatase [Tanacetum coccineum]
MASFQASSDDVQKLAHDFFCAMDNDGDGKIDKKEFLEFMQVQGYCRQATNLYLFKQLGPVIAHFCALLWGVHPFYKLPSVSDAMEDDPSGRRGVHIFS